MTDPATLLVDAEDAVADALDTEAVEVQGVEAATLESGDRFDPWHEKGVALAKLTIAGAEEALDNTKRLLVLAEEAAMGETHATTRAEKLLDVADRWNRLVSL